MRVAGSVACLGGALTALWLSASACSDESTSRHSVGRAGGGGAGGDAGAGLVGGSAGAGAAAGGASTGGGGAGGSAACTLLSGDDELELGVALEDSEHTLALDAVSIPHTSWAEPGNEALVLEVRVNATRLAELVLHRGADGGRYGMHLGALGAGDRVSAVISPLSASTDAPAVCVGAVALERPADADAIEAIAHAPVFHWPVSKRFDDLPMVLGWSKARQEYQLVTSNENGGTVEICGGGAEGVQAEIARWGRAVDIERSYRYGGSDPQWGRCTGTTGVSSHPVRMEGAHPIFYYGDGHNRLFESRGGYGATCGSGGAEKADGDLPGWNVESPGNDAALDGPFVVILRPLPVSLDALGYAEHSGRREGLVDRYAPWLYRILDAELRREGKIDQAHAFGMQQYLYVDVRAADVGGTGDELCSFWGVSAGFKLRARISGNSVDGPQMTADYFGGAVNVKRIAIPLGAVVSADEITGLVFDAYDDDGIYWLALGDVFMARPSGDNGATIDTVHAADTSINVYVDDDSSGCSAGTNGDGPEGPASCVGGQYLFEW